MAACLLALTIQLLEEALEIGHENVLAPQYFPLGEQLRKADVADHVIAVLAPILIQTFFSFQRRKFQDLDAPARRSNRSFRFSIFSAVSSSLKHAFTFLHNICELFFSTLKMISRFDPVEEIEHCIGRKEITQIYRNHQYNRLAFLPSCHCPVNRTQIYRSQKYRHRYTISLCLMPQFFDRNFCLCV